MGSCLFDHGQFANNLDHSAEGILPGERFDADQQCMLKYGHHSMRAKNQKQADICTDLHCQRERYTWTSHPALEGTECGANMVGGISVGDLKGFNVPLFPIYSGVVVVLVSYVRHMWNPITRQNL